MTIGPPPYRTPSNQLIYNYLQQKHRYNVKITSKLSNQKSLITVRKRMF